MAIHFYNNKWIQLFLTLIIAIIGGYLFQFIKLPIPWLLGPMFFVLIFSKINGIKLYWPNKIRDAAMIIIGYTIGLSFTASTFIQIGHQLPSMILMTFLLILFTITISIIISKLFKIHYPTVLLGSIPGGLSQMIALAEEIKDVDFTIVTFLQISRLMMIIFMIPLFIFSPFFDIHKNSISEAIQHSSASWHGLFPNIIIYAIACTLLGLLGKKINFPTALLLGPMVASIILNLSGLHGPALPSVILDGSQLMMGSYIGLLLNPEKLTNKLKIVLVSILSGIILLAFSLLSSIFLTHIHSIDPLTALLGLAPGGMDQMALIAKEVDADITVIMCYQLFRTLFIFIVVPYLLRYIFRARIQESKLKRISNE
ncbi:AbrB family transcriptional regulator [Bacillus sp. AFS041924]|uniref:AbrB family transcriptional regulator n=1 Tax=Bacillus sp. AFS041924 TaxID=2033503 RepID=UPI000BFC7E00|nr:AbrB family transcriptional regulator [Bacillus sp. AFS041924]PGS50620.1 AbrB family transcriptional regulator [Bacillus sp. AFS041924]